MKLSLTPWQRIHLAMIVGGLRGDVRLMRKAIKALDILDLTEAEEAKIGYKQTPTGSQWSDTERRFELEIKDKEAATVVKQAAESYTGWPVAQAREVIDLCQQLGIEIDEKEPKPAEERQETKKKQS